MRFCAFCLLLVFLSCAGVFAQLNVITEAYEKAAEMAASMDDSTLAAQVLLTGIDGKESLSPAMKSLLERIPAGGIMLFRYNLDSPKAGVKKFLSETASLIEHKTGVPPFMAVDHEGGLVHRFGPGVERLPSAFSFWRLALQAGREEALERAKTLYRRSAAEISEMGINLVLGPVAETLSEENSAFLDTRSYGPDSGFTEEAACLFIESMGSEGIACVLKHFPGNGTVDPHGGVSYLDADRETLDEMVKPFAGLIRHSNPAAVMVSHVIVKALDGKNNASLSSLVIENWLRGELGFGGIVLADDFSMGAVRALGFSPAEAAVKALNAGVDMIMVWPNNLISVHASILAALKEGRLKRERLLEAAGRIIGEKLKQGIVPPETARKKSLTADTTAQLSYLFSSLLIMHENAWRFEIFKKNI